jgi:regulator of replication initiation timing
MCAQVSSQLEGLQSLNSNTVCENERLNLEFNQLRANFKEMEIEFGNNIDVIESLKIQIIELGYLI